MLMFLVLFLFLAGVTAGLWFHGLWSNVLTGVNLTFAGIVATNYYEPLAATVQENVPALEPLADIISFWVLFAISFAILRGIAALLSSTRLEFPFQFEIIGRSLLAFVNAWIFLCIFTFSLHFAPIAEEPLGWNTSNSAFLFLSPDGMWISFSKWWSKGSLSRDTFEPRQVSPDDAAWKAQPFDSMGEWVRKHQGRRGTFEKVDGLLR